jgi:ATP-dependent helicase/nuclease subunit A
MTRAKDRLYVAGVDKKISDDDRSRRWHALIATALEPQSRRIEDGEGNLVALDWRAADLPPAGEAPPPPAVEETVIPDWAKTDAPAHGAPVLRLSPSALAGEAGFPAPAVLSAALGPEPNAALRRGRLVHRLLQSLPDHPPAGRLAVATRFLEAAVGDLDAGWRAALLAEVLAVLADPGFAAVFGEGSRAEVEIAGTVTTGRGEAVVSGRIDRLAVTPGRVLIVDYETNRPPPADLAGVPPAYVAQLALYRLVLARLYPGRPVAAAILWTDRPALMEIPAAALDSAVSALSGP